MIGALAAMGATFASYPFDLIRTRHSLQSDGINVHIILDGPSPTLLILLILATLQWDPSDYPDYTSGRGSTRVLQGTWPLLGPGNALHGACLCFL